MAVTSAETSAAVAALAAEASAADVAAAATPASALTNKAGTVFSNGACDEEEERDVEAFVVHDSDYEDVCRELETRPMPVPVRRQGVSRRSQRVRLVVHAQSM